MFKFKNNKGFTLIELIVVIAIIGILVLLAVPKFIGHTKEAKATKLVANTKNLETASERYYMDNQNWPRLNDKPYTSAQIEAFSQKIYDATGKTVTLDPTGQYYDIDYSKLSKYISVPDDELNYVIQNPVGNIYGLATPTKESLERLIVVNKKPTAVIKMTPSIELTTDSSISWSYSDSTDSDGDSIINAEWDNALSKYGTPGSYTARLRVQDSKGLWSQWESITFNISSPNRKPTAVITYTPNSNINISTNISWSYANSTDVDGDNIIAAEWRLDDVIIENPSGVLSPGTHVMSLRVKDSKGLWSDSVSTTIVVSAISPYLKFNGTNGFTRINDSASLDILNKITIEAKVMFTEVAVKEIVLKNESSNIGVGPYELFQQGDRITLRLSALPYNPVEITSNTSLSLNTWHHIAGVWDGTTMKLYINGVQDSKTLAFNKPLYNSSGYLTFGAYADLRYPYAGGLDEVRIWNVARTAQQITDNMNSNLVGNESGLMGYWKFNEGTGSIVYDSSVNKNNGTNFGNVIWMTK